MGMSAPTVTLLSDFGTQDVYVGVLKGVIGQICPAARLIDLTHEIAPQDRWAAWFNLQVACPYFPAGTVHLAVVDPGVGTARRAIALQVDQMFLVGPDNGIFSGLWQGASAVTAVALTRPQYWRTPMPSATFHGRDVFASVAAHLAQGVPLAALGDPIALASLVRLELPAIAQQGEATVGVVQHCDRFGNLITNLPATVLPASAWQAVINGHCCPGGKTYDTAPTGSAVALIGSHGWIEIAINGGSAQQQLQAGVGSRVTVGPASPSATGRSEQLS